MSVRKCSRWRKAAFERIAARDGATCGRCSAKDRIVWRRNGVTSGPQWGEDMWECARHTIVYPTSILEVDHRQPLSEGGTNDDDNLWLLCMDCHKAKTSGERSARLKALFAAARA